MSGHSIAYMREWLDDELDQEDSGSPEFCRHLRAVLAIAERANGIPQVAMDGKPFDPVAAAPTIAAGDRYHYALGQLAKAREFLLQGRAAAAMDAIHRAMDGIIEE